MRSIEWVVSGRKTVKDLPGICPSKYPSTG
jgi:hypothetical protein